MNKKYIVAISGKFCSGKSTVSTILEKMGFEKKYFAKSLKEVAKYLFGKDKKDRKLLQILGEKLREIDEDVFVNFLLREINESPNEFFVIDDLRFKNEYFKLSELNALFIRLECNKKERLKRCKKLYGYIPSDEMLYHKSEVDLDDLPKSAWHLIIHTDRVSKENIEKVVKKNIKNIAFKLWGIKL